MVNFIAISGPAQSGKTSLIDNLSTCKEISKEGFSPDLFNTVWSNLVEQGVFRSYDEIVRDSDFICVYLMKVIEHYENYISMYEKIYQGPDKNKIVFLDCCWIDLLVYSVINMWYSRAIADLQAEMIDRIMKLCNTVDRIYLTKYDENKHVTQKYRSDYKIYSVKSNRGLEFSYYNLFQNFKNVVKLDTSDISEASLFIIDDLKKLGYL